MSDRKKKNKKSVDKKHGSPGQQAESDLQKSLLQYETMLQQASKTMTEIEAAQRELDIDGVSPRVRIQQLEDELAKKDLRCKMLLSQLNSSLVAQSGAAASAGGAGTDTRPALAKDSLAMQAIRQALSELPPSTAANLLTLSPTTQSPDISTATASSGALSPRPASALSPDPSSVSVTSRTLTALRAERTSTQRAEKQLSASATRLHSRACLTALLTCVCAFIAFLHVAVHLSDSLFPRRVLI